MQETAVKSFFLKVLNLTLAHLKNPQIRMLPLRKCRPDSDSESEGFKFDWNVCTFTSVSVEIQM